MLNRFVILLHKEEISEQWKSSHILIRDFSWFIAKMFIKVGEGNSLVANTRLFDLNDDKDKTIEAILYSSSYFTSKASTYSLQPKVISSSEDILHDITNKRHFI